MSGIDCAIFTRLDALLQQIFESIRDTRRLEDLLYRLTDPMPARGQFAQSHWHKLGALREHRGVSSREHQQSILQRLGTDQQRPDRFGDLPDMSADHRAVEFFLRLEMVVEHRLVDPGAFGDPVDSSPGEPKLGELFGSGFQQPIFG